MSESERPPLDSDGFVDMDALDASDRADLDEGSQARLHEALIRSPVPTPSPGRFDELIEQATQSGAAPTWVDDLVPHDLDPVDAGVTPPPAPDPEHGYDVDWGDAHDDTGGVFDHTADDVDGDEAP